MYIYIYIHIYIRIYNRIIIHNIIVYFWQFIESVAPEKVGPILYQELSANDRCETKHNWYIKGPSKVEMFSAIHKNRPQ